MTAGSARAQEREPFEEVRRPKTQGGGTHRWDRVDLLAGLLACASGRQLKSDSTFADGRHRKMHPAPCAAWRTLGALRRRDV